jgi:hypothetical protein
MIFYGMAYTSNCFGKDLCINENANLRCLRENFDDLYAKNYTIFWKILREAGDAASECRSYDDIDAFLKLSSIRNRNAEFKEYLNEIIENLTIRKSAIFLDALSRLDDNSIYSVIGLLQRPIFIPIEDIKKVFYKNRNNKKYKKVMNVYFKKSKEQERNKGRGEKK